jgi:hypothetical protein
VFLKVDVDKCPGTAAAYNVSAMPTFIFFRNRAELERLRGANKDQLENKVKQYYSSTSTPEKPTEPVDPAAAAGIEGDFVNKNLLLTKSLNGLIIIFYSYKRLIWPV